MVNPERNFWYCFGCQKGGDIFSFVQEMEGVEFREALERLAERAGVEIPRYSPKARQEKSKKQKMLEILELATKFYQHQLENHAKGQQIKQYLAERKIDGELVNQFRLGYAPDGWRNILDFLTNKGYLAAEIAETGLLVQKEGNRDQYDRFRDRIMFPIQDVTGKIVGYSARVAPGGDESSAKYINTPETAVYNKSQVLYGLNQAKTDVRGKDFLVIVEGNTDVISSHQTDLKNVVAVSGTALTNEHIKIIKHYTNNVKLCFDMDEAGQRATVRSIQTCLKGEMETEIIFLPGGIKDVSDLVKKNPKEWEKVAEKAVPVMEYFFQSALKKYDPEDRKDKKLIAKELLNIIKDIADPIEQNYWLKKLSVTIGVNEDLLTNVLEKAKLEVRETHQGEDDLEKKEITKSKTRQQILQERLLGLYFAFFTELKSQSKKVEENLAGSEYEEIFQAIKQGEEKKFQMELNEMTLKVKYGYDEKQGFVENETEPLKELKIVVEELQKEKVKQKRDQIVLDIKRAEAEGDNESAELLMKELQKISG